MSEENAESFVENSVDNAENSKNGVSAKTISKVFKFVSAAGVIVCAVLKWAGVLPEATIGEICASWAVVYGLGAGTIDANIIIDKYTGRA